MRLTAPQIMNLPSKLDGGQPFPSLEIIYYGHFSSYNAVENEAHFVLERPSYNSIKDIIFYHYLGR